MTYLFWAFAVVWIGLFVYLYGLVRRSRSLERRIAELAERTHMAPPNVPPAGTVPVSGAAAAPGAVPAIPSRRSAGE